MKGSQKSKGPPPGNRGPKSPPKFSRAPGISNRKRELSLEELLEPYVRGLLQVAGLGPVLRAAAEWAAERGVPYGVVRSLCVAWSDYESGGGDRAQARRDVERAGKEVEREVARLRRNRGKATRSKGRE